MIKENPKPNYWQLVFWNKGDKFKSCLGDFFTEEELWNNYKNILPKYDNVQCIEVFHHVFSAMGIEACENIDTRDFIYDNE